MPKQEKMVALVHQVSYHRNGVGGDGFHAVIFDHDSEHCSKCKGFYSAGWTDSSGKPLPCINCGNTMFETVHRKMVGVVFDGPGGRDHTKRQLAALDLIRVLKPLVGETEDRAASQLVSANQTEEG